MRKGAIIFFACILFVIVMTGLLISIFPNRDFDSPPKPPVSKFVTLSFVDVGYEYNILNWEKEERYIFFEGDITFKKGTRVSIRIMENEDYTCAGYIFNNETTVEKRKVFFNDETNWTKDFYKIQAIIVESTLKRIYDGLRDSNFTILRVSDVYRVSGFSHSLTKIEMPLESLMDFCSKRDIDFVFHYRGRVGAQGWRWDKWDYFFFIEGDIFYYHRAGID